jgi:hypothetical protein
MKSKIFVIERPTRIPNQSEAPEAEYRLPVLPAYAIEYAELRVTSSWDGLGQTVLLEGRGLKMDGDKIIWTSYKPGIFGEPAPITLIVNYHGIRSYELLFPTVRSSERLDRLAKFYEEADKTFEEGAWLSFLTMCGAVFEGLLFDRLNQDFTYDELAKEALTQKVINYSEYMALERVRVLRNRVHIGRADEAYPVRADAMDIRKVLDDMIVRFSYGEDC